MASLPHIEQYLAANPEIAARIKQQMEEAMAAMVTGKSSAATSAAVLRAQEQLMSMLSQQSLAALTQSMTAQASAATLQRERERERERERLRDMDHNGNASASIREVTRMIKSRPPLVD